MTVRITDQGLPRSVASAAKLPASAYEGHFCVTEDDGSVYVFCGSAYVKLATSAGSVSTAADAAAKSYATTSDFPSSATAGTLVFCVADTSFYGYNGSVWNKIAVSPET